MESDKSKKIIVALDVGSYSEAIALVEKLPDVTFWKVGLELFLGAGPAILNYLRQNHKRIFLDLKFHDIPNTVAKACQQSAQFGVELVTVHGAAGSEAMRSAQEQLANQGLQLPKIIAITALTSLSSEQLDQELHINLAMPDYVLAMARLAQAANLGGVVCSPQEVTLLKQACGADFLAICPGIRPDWAEAGEQRRSSTPQAALAGGADYLVIGRPITAAADPKGAWLRICEEIA